MKSKNVINFNTYIKRNGDLMVYVNRSNGVSVGICERGAPDPNYMTRIRKNVLNMGRDVFFQYAKPFTGDLAEHQETKVRVGNLYTLALTDAADIGGMDVGSDGAYLVRDNKILPIGSQYRYELTV